MILVDDDDDDDDKKLLNCKLKHLKEPQPVVCDSAVNCFALPVEVCTCST